MLIEIQGEHTGSITMFGDAAKQLLKMMGQSGQPKGAIRAEDVAGALHQLQASLNQLEEPPVADENEDDNDQVSLKTRAIPLIDLLQTNVEKGGYVMWEPK